MDIITYTANIAQLRLDIAAIASAAIDPENPHLAQRICQDDSESGIRLLLTKIPTVKNGNASVSRVRGVSRAVIDAIPSLEVIGTAIGHVYTFDDGGEAKYFSVHDTTPKTWIDDAGIRQTATTSDSIGGFC